MKTVWKFNAPFSEDATVDMPIGARVVHFAHQNAGFNAIQIWAEVDPNADKEGRRFSIHGTGHPIPADSTYLASCIDGALVWHLYERAA